MIQNIRNYLVICQILHSVVNIFVEGLIPDLSNLRKEGTSTVVSYPKISVLRTYQPWTKTSVLRDITSQGQSEPKDVEHTKANHSSDTSSQNQLVKYLTPPTHSLVSNTPSICMSKVQQITQECLEVSSDFSLVNRKKGRRKYSRPAQPSCCLLKSRIFNCISFSPRPKRYGIQFNLTLFAPFLLQAAVV